MAITLLPASAHRPVYDWEQIVVKKGDLFDGIAYPPGTSVTVFKGTRTVLNVRLSDFQINGHGILAGSQLYLKAGKLRSYFTAKGQTINNGIVLPTDSQISFDDHGRLHMILPRGAVKIAGRTYRGHNWIQFGANGEVISAEAD